MEGIFLDSSLSTIRLSTFRVSGSKCNGKLLVDVSAIESSQPPLNLNVAFVVVILI